VAFADHRVAHSEVITSADELNRWLNVPDNGIHNPWPPSVRSEPPAESGWTCVSSRPTTLERTEEHTAKDTAVAVTHEVDGDTTIRCRFM